MAFVGCGVIRRIVRDREPVGGRVALDAVRHAGRAERFVEFLGVVGGERRVVLRAADVDGGADPVGQQVRAVRAVGHQTAGVESCRGGPLDGHPVARVDRKTDRAADSLPVAGVLGELDIPPVTVAEGLAGELASMASWLGLGGIAVSTRGDLAGELCAATKRTNG